MRASSWSLLFSRNTLTLRAVSCLPCSATSCAWMMATPLRHQLAVGLAQPELAAMQCQRPAAAAELGVLQWLRRGRTSRRRAGCRPWWRGCRTAARRRSVRRGTARPTRRTRGRRSAPRSGSAARSTACRPAAPRRAGPAWRCRAAAAPAISVIRPSVTSGLLAARRSSSRKSNSDTRPVSASSMAVTQRANCRVMYQESVTATVTGSARRLAVQGEGPPQRGQQLRAEQQPGADERRAAAACTHISGISALLRAARLSIARPAASRPHHRADRHQRPDEAALPAERSGQHRQQRDQRVGHAR